jgi:hypothetical protein
MNMNQFLNQVERKDLAKAAIKQLGGWESFKESAIDIANNSIDGGFHGFIYYTETVPFAENYLGLIKDFAKTEAEDFGTKSIYEMFSKFKCMLDLTVDEIIEAIHNKSDENRTTVMNCLAWYAGETVARWYADSVGA